MLTTTEALEVEEQGVNAMILLLALALVMLLVTFLSGGVPIFIKGMLMRSGKAYLRWHSLLSCFSGGVFLATTFLDIIPHVIYADLRTQGYFDVPFPLAEFVMCVGFFAVYFLELVIMSACMKGFNHAHAHAHNNSTVDDSTPPPPRALNNIHKEDPDSSHMTSNSTIHEEVIVQAAKYVASEDNTTHSFIKTITFTFAISFHSILEGFALGVQVTQAAIISLFVSLIIHKAVEAFSVGLQVAKGQSKKWHYFLTVGIYSVMTPIGIGLGVLLRTTHFGARDPIIAILESMACGTFMYVTFLEILAEEKANGQNETLQLLATFVGFCVISLLQLFFH